jgi:hypothetical protein
VARALDAHGIPATDRLMSIDSAGYRYYTGRGGVVLVNDPLETIETVAAAYGVRWLVLERTDAVESVAPVLAGTRPPWIGRPIWQQAAASADGAEAVGVAVYPVCLVAGDSRCEQPTGATP